MLPSLIVQLLKKNAYVSENKNIEEILKQNDLKYQEWLNRDTSKVHASLFMEIFKKIFSTFINQIIV